MKNNTTIKRGSNPKGLINPERFWALEDELISIPLAFRERYWNELLAGFSQDLPLNIKSNVEKLN